YPNPPGALKAAIMEKADLGDPRRAHCMRRRGTRGKARQQPPRPLIWGTNAAGPCTEPQAARFFQGGVGRNAGSRPTHRRGPEGQNEAADFVQAMEKSREFRLGPLGTLNQVVKALGKTIRAMADGSLDSQRGARICNGLGIMRACLETQ